MTTTTGPDWGTRATLAQRSLEHFYGADQPQYLHNVFPLGDGDDETFNYWWLAHLIDARLDAFERTGQRQWLDAAIAAYDNIVERNDGSLFNDYFDDMLWLAIAALRLHDASSDVRYLTAATDIWQHVVEFGWNPTMGESLAWRKQQLYYKNTPANAPLVILSCRLFARDARPQYLDIATRAHRWLTETLVDPTTGFVEDGINREEDGRIDTQWRFTYNQGLYVGACVELFRATGDASLLAAAERTAFAAIRELAVDGVFADEGDGGDEGLFKGVYFRYLRELLPLAEPATRDALASFVQSAAESLWQNSQRDGFLLAGNDWTRPAGDGIPYSTQLSAIMALELMAWIVAGSSGGFKSVSADASSRLAEN